MLGLEKIFPKKFIDVSALAWGLVVGTPGGFEQKADGKSLQNGPQERLERSLSGGRVLGLKTKVTKDLRRRECVGMGFSHWARLAVSNRRLTKETLQSGPRERLERSRRWRWARA